LAAAVGDPGRKGAALRTAAWKNVADRLARPPGIDASTNAGDLLGVLESQGFVGFEAIGTRNTLGAFPGRGASLVLAVGEQGDVPSKDVIMPATSAIVSARISLVVADAWQATKRSPNRGDALAELRADALARTVSTVDDLDRPQGPLTIALALSGLLDAPAVVGHYGYGSDTKPLPEFARP